MSLEECFEQEINEKELMPPIYDEKIQLTQVFPFIDLVSWKSILQANSLDVLMNKASQGQLSFDEEAVLTNKVKGWSEFDHLNGNQVQDVIEKYPNIGLLLVEKGIESKFASEIYQVLVHMNVSLNALDVMKQLYDKKLSGLPREIFCLFLSNAFDSVRSNVDQKDRNVRLLCMFIKGMDADFIESMRIEIESFLLEHSQQKEATELFKQLK